MYKWCEKKNTKKSFSAKFNLSARPVVVFSSLCMPVSLCVYSSCNIARITSYTYTFVVSSPPPPPPPPSTNNTTFVRFIEIYDLCLITAAAADKKTAERRRQWEIFECHHDARGANNNNKLLGTMIIIYEIIFMSRIIIIWTRCMLYTCRYTRRFASFYQPPPPHKMLVF